MAHRAIVDDIEVTIQDQIDYSEQTNNDSNQALQEPWSVTLTLAEWAVVGAALRGAMLFSQQIENGRPGIVRISHDRIFEQLPTGKLEE